MRRLCTCVCVCVCASMRIVVVEAWLPLSPIITSFVCIGKFRSANPTEKYFSVAEGKVKMNQSSNVSHFICNTQHHPDSLLWASSQKTWGKIGKNSANPTYLTLKRCESFSFLSFSFFLSLLFTFLANVWLSWNLGKERFSSIFLSQLHSVTFSPILLAYLMCGRKQNSPKSQPSFMRRGQEF